MDAHETQDAHIRGTVATVTVWLCGGSSQLHETQDVPASRLELPSDAGNTFHIPSIHDSTWAQEYPDWNIDLDPPFQPSGPDLPEAAVPKSSRRLFLDGESAVTPVNMPKQQGMLVPQICTKLSSPLHQAQEHMLKSCLVDYSTSTNMGLPFMLRDHICLKDSPIFGAIVADLQFQEWHVDNPPSHIVAAEVSRSGDTSDCTNNGEKTSTLEGAELKSPPLTRLHPEIVSKWHRTLYTLLYVKEALQLPNTTSVESLDRRVKPLPSEYNLAAFRTPESTMRVARLAQRAFFPVLGDLTLAVQLYMAHQAVRHLETYLQDKGIPPHWVDCFRSSCVTLRSIPRVGLNINIKIPIQHEYFNALIRAAVPLLLNWGTDAELAEMLARGVISDPLRAFLPSPPDFADARTWRQALCVPGTGSDILPRFCVDSSAEQQGSLGIPLSMTTFFQRREAEQLPSDRVSYTINHATRVFLWVYDGHYLVRRQVHPRSHNTVLEMYLPSQKRFNASRNEWDVYGGWGQITRGWPLPRNPSPYLIRSLLPAEHLTSEVSLNTHDGDQWAGLDEVGNSSFERPHDRVFESFLDDDDDEHATTDDSDLDFAGKFGDPNQIRLDPKARLEPSMLGEPEYLPLEPKDIATMGVVIDPLAVLLRYRFGFRCPPDETYPIQVSWINKRNQPMQPWSTKVIAATYGDRDDSIDWSTVNVDMVRNFTRTIDDYNDHGNAGLDLDPGIVDWNEKVPSFATGIFSVRQELLNFSRDFDDYAETDTHQAQLKSSPPTEEKAYILELVSANLSIVVKSASTAMQCLRWIRDDMLLSNPDKLFESLSSNMARRGMAFKTSRRVASHLPYPSKTISYGDAYMRRQGWVGSPQDFQAWEADISNFLYTVSGRAACMCGGIIWRIAMEYGPKDLFEHVVGGPSHLSSGQLNQFAVDKDGTGYWDDLLLPQELRLMTGTYRVMQGPCFSTVYDAVQSFLHKISTSRPDRVVLLVSADVQMAR